MLINCTGLNLSDSESTNLVPEAKKNLGVPEEAVKQQVPNGEPVKKSSSSSSGFGSDSESLSSCSKKEETAVMDIKLIISNVPKDQRKPTIKCKDLGSAHQLRKVRAMNSPASLSCSGSESGTESPPLTTNEKVPLILRFTRHRDGRKPKWSVRDSSHEYAAHRYQFQSQVNQCSGR